MQESVSYLQLLESVKRAPHIYLLSYPESGGASIYTNLIQILFGSTQDQKGDVFTVPHRLVIHSEYHNHVALAYGAQFRHEEFVAENLEAYDFDDLLRWTYEAPVTWSSEFATQSSTIAPTVAVTEFCHLSASTIAAHFEQQFHNGKPSTPVVRKYADTNTTLSPYLGLSFSLQQRIFNSLEIDPSLLENAVKWLITQNAVPSNLILREVFRERHRFEVIVSLSD